MNAGQNARKDWKIICDTVIILVLAAAIAAGLVGDLSAVARSLNRRVIFFVQNQSRLAFNWPCG